jgi:hypothetical protein
LAFDGASFREILVKANVAIDAQGAGNANACSQRPSISRIPGTSQCLLLRDKQNNEHEHIVCAEFDPALDDGTLGQLCLTWYPWPETGSVPPGLQLVANGHGQLFAIEVRPHEASGPRAVFVAFDQTLLVFATSIRRAIMLCDFAQPSSIIDLSDMFQGCDLGLGWNVYHVEHIYCDQHDILLIFFVYKRDDQEFYWAKCYRDDDVWFGDKDFGLCQSMKIVMLDEQVWVWRQTLEQYSVQMNQGLVQKAVHFVPEHYQFTQPDLFAIRQE